MNIIELVKLGFALATLDIIRIILVASALFLLYKFVKRLHVFCMYFVKPWFEERALRSQVRQEMRNELLKARRAK